MAFTWSVLSLECVPQLDGQTNVVVIVYWKCEGEQGGCTSMVERNTQVTLQADATFVPFDQLTEAQVLAWIPDKTKTSTEAELQAAIDKQLNPPTIDLPLPWIS